MRPRGEGDRFPLPAGEPNFVEITGSITPADQDKALGRVHRHTVAARVRQTSGVAPTGRGGLEHKEAVIPDFCAALPRAFVGKVSPTGYDQRVPADASVAAGKALAVGQGWEFAPTERWGSDHVVGGLGAGGSGGQTKCNDAKGDGRTTHGGDWLVSWLVEPVGASGGQWIYY